MKLFKRITRSQKIFIVLIILSAISTVYLYTYSHHPSSPPPVSPSPAPVRSSTELLNQIEYSSVEITNQANWPSLPSTLPTYSASVLKIDPTLLVNSIGNYFHLKPHAANSSIWASADNSQAVGYDSYVATVDFITESSLKSSAYFGNNNPDLAASLPVASAFISQLNLPEKLEADQQNVTFMKLPPDSMEFYPTTKQDANMIVVPFKQTVDGFPIFNSAVSTPPATATFAQSNQIVRFSISPSFVHVSSRKSQFSTLSSDDLLSQLKSGQATVIGTYLGDLPHNPLPSISITNIQAEYRLDSSSQTLLPYLRFTGTYTNPVSKLVNPIILILPAIKL
jgi:hypothetical protein